jgi:hypothetical protein
MELLTYPKAEYLLDASLESLHAESLEWLKEIDFWRDEMAFFYKILHRKETRNSFPTQEVAAIEKDLIGINGEKLDRIRHDVQHHEQSLSVLLKGNSIQDEEKYRRTHREILLDISSLNLIIRNFKRELFSFVQKY